MFKFNYFNGSNHLSQGFISLFSGRMIQQISCSLIGVFLPIYLLINLGYKTEHVIYYYLTGYVAYTIFLPWGAQFLNRVGLKKSLLISIILFTFYYISLYFLKDYLALSVIFSLIFLTLARTFFWMPYNTDLAKFTDRTNRGKGISIIQATTNFLGVALPVIAGFLINLFGYPVVFILAISIYLTSLIPFMALPDTEEKFSWSYWETLKHLFAKKNRTLVLANMANGAESMVGAIIWPIFIWQLLKGDYVAVGALSSLIVFVTILMELSVGKYTDIFDKRKMIHWGSVLYALGWVIKIFVLTSMQIFVAGAYHSLARIFKETPFEALNYELIADKGHYVDEYTVIKEMAIQFGSILMLLFILLVIANFSLNWTFALAALVSLFINLL